MIESAAALVREGFASEREALRKKAESMRRETDEARRKLAAAREVREILRIRLVEAEIRAGNLPSSGTRGNRRVVFASDEILEARLAMCRSGCCGQYQREHDACTDCRCFVSAKAKLTTENCPLGLWLA